MRIEHPDGTVEEHYGGHASTTNNLMELVAAAQAVEHLPAEARAFVISDSQYVVRGVNEWAPGWASRSWQTYEGKAIKNIEAWKRLLQACAEHPNVEVRWCKGHATTQGNIRADELANLGMRPFIGEPRQEAI